MTHELGPLPYPAAEAAMNLCADHQGPVEAMQFLPEDTQLFTADQMRAYALAEVARAVAAERAKHAGLLEALKGLLADTQHAQHHCHDPECPVSKAEAAIYAAQAHGQTPGSADAPPA